MTVNRPGVSRARFAAALGATCATLSSVRTAKAAPAYTMRLSNPDTATSLLGTAMSSFAAAVGRRSNGQLSIEVYPNGQLAKQQEIVQDLLSGVIDFGVIGASFLTQLFPVFQILDLPFPFRDLAAGYRVLDSPVTTDLYAQLEQKGIAGIAVGIAAFKQIETTAKPITLPDDLRGLRLRVQTGAVPVATYQALGAIPVAVDLSETLVALSQHTVDGMDFTVDAFTTFKAYTVVKCCAMTNQFFSSTPLLASKQKLDALPMPLQRIVREVAGKRRKRDLAWVARRRKARIKSHS